MLRVLSLTKPYGKRNLLLVNNYSKNTNFLNNILFNIPKGFEKYYRKPTDSNAPSEKVTENKTEDKTRTKTDPKYKGTGTSKKSSQNGGSGGRGGGFNFSNIPPYITIATGIGFLLLSFLSDANGRYENKNSWM